MVPAMPLTMLSRFLHPDPRIRRVYLRPVDAKTQD